MDVLKTTFCLLHLPCFFYLLARYWEEMAEWRWLNIPFQHSSSCGEKDCAA